MGELWLGHDIKLASAYYRPTVADMREREEYSKAINLLTNEENRLKEKVTELERKQDEMSLLKYQHEMAMKKVFDDQLRMQSEFQKLEQAVNLTLKINKWGTSRALNNKTKRIHKSLQ